MATFNGQSVGNDEGPAVTSSLKPEAAAAAQTSQPEEQKSGTNFDFNFDAAPA